MPLFEELDEEHRLVDRVAGSLCRLSERLKAGEAAATDIGDFVHFLRVYVGDYHHQREEVLFAALVEHAEVPADRGPIPIIVDEHRESALLVETLASSADFAAAAQTARKIAHHLWEHLDKEDSVIFPEARQRLVRGGVSRLEGRGATAAEEAARTLGEELTARFPPLEDPDVIRGDGCIACSAFAITCGGIEKEWWNDWEVEYHRSLDEG